MKIRAREVFAAKMAAKKELREQQLEINRAAKLRRDNAFKYNRDRFGENRAKFIAVYMRDLMYGHGVRPSRARESLSTTSTKAD